MTCKNQMQPRANRDGERGFSLIEAVIALLVLLIVSLGVGSLFTYAIRYNSGANDRALAMSVAQQRMEQLTRVSFSQIVASGPDVVTSAGRSYTVTVTVCTTSSCGGSSTLKVITVQATPRSASGNWVRQAATLRSLRADQLLGPYL